MMPREGHEIATSLCSSQRRLDCGNPRCGFARICCPGCGEERLLMFSCRTRGFCPSCHAKRLEEWGEWVRETLLLDVPHRQVVFVIPKMLRVFFKRRLLGELCHCAVRTVLYGTDMGNACEMYQATFRILETADEHFYEFELFDYHWPLHGFALGDGILKKIYRDNALKIAGKIKGR